MNISFRTKLIVCAIFAAALVFTVGMIGVWTGNKLTASLTQVTDNKLPSVSLVLEMRGSLADLEAAQNALLNPELTEQERAIALERFHSSRQSYRDAAMAYQAIEHGEAEVLAFERFKTIVSDWAVANDQFLETFNQLESTGITNPTDLVQCLDMFVGDHYKLMFEVSMAIDTRQYMYFSHADDECRFGQWLLSQRTDSAELEAMLDTMVQPHTDFHIALGDISVMTDEGEWDAAEAAVVARLHPLMAELMPAFNALREAANRSVEMRERMIDLAANECATLKAEVLASLDAIVADTEASVHELKTEVAAQETLAGRIVWTGVIVGSLLCLVFGSYIGHRVTVQLQQLIERMNSGSSQVTSASGQVSGTSQSLADGASHQASSLEEISASLEEMTAMTSQNAENAAQANEVAGNVSSRVETGLDAMQRMDETITRIKTSADQTANIIKTIDEIAFQTNILALNAAVEAARAGEAGQGFAVVAGEVRDLAQRSAASARDTTNLINEAQSNAAEGVSMSQEVSAILTEIVAAATDMTKLIKEVSVASSEQAQGIGQVTISVAQMDSITQSNAGNAEELASASEELSAQSRELEAMVLDLVQLVEGRRSTAAVASLEAEAHYHLPA